MLYECSIYIQVAKKNPVIAIIQFRTDTSEQHEQECFKKYLPDADLEFLSIYSNNVSFDEPEELLKNYDKVILAGSGELLLSRGDEKTNSVYETIKPLMDYVLETDYPTLGVCFGNQILGKAIGGEVRNEESQAEAGIQQVRFTEAGRSAQIFKNMHNPLSVAMGHEDSVLKLPKKATWLAYSAKCPAQAFRHGENVFGVQFHVELDDKDLAERLKMYSQYDEYQLGYDVPDGVHGPQVLKNFATI